PRGAVVLVGARDGSEEGAEVPERLEGAEHDGDSDLAAGDRVVERVAEERVPAQGGGGDEGLAEVEVAASGNDREQRGEHRRLVRRVRDLSRLLDQRLAAGPGWNLLERVGGGAELAEARERPPGEVGGARAVGGS